ncbi:MAG: hypothetical protein Q7R79_00280, partial [bacterium]|nr:hypothetical protein [bacterium]
MPYFSYTIRNIRIFAVFTLLTILLGSVPSAEKTVFASHPADLCPTHAPTGEDGTATTKIGGWAWNGFFEWLSQSGSYDYILPNGQKKKCTYRVYRKGKGRIPEKAEDAGIFGWSKFSTVGEYVCWGATCSTLPVVKDPSNSSVILKNNKPPGGFEPFARIVREDIKDGDTVVGEKLVVKGVLKIIDEQGFFVEDKDRWICLSPDALGPGKTICRTGITADGKEFDVKDYELLYDEKTNEFSGFAWSRSLGWFSFSGRVFGDQQVTLCKNPSNAVEKEAFYKTLPKNFLEKNKDLGIDAAVLKWSTECNTNITKISFSDNQSKWKTYYIGPGTRVKVGSAYSGVGFSGKSVLSEVDYLIFTNNTTNENHVKNWSSLLKTAPGAITTKPTGGTSFSPTLRSTPLQLKTAPPKTEKGEVKIKLPTAPPPKSGQQTQQKALIRSRVGSINIKALTTLPNAPGGKNQYGYKVVPINNSNVKEKLCLNNNENCDLNGRVFISDGDLALDETTIGRFLQFSNKPLAKSKEFSNGTVIVKGDLQIKIPLYYEKSSIAAFKNLASISWIVLKREDGSGGNVIIDDCLHDVRDNFKTRANIVGVFLAEGKIITGTGRYTAQRNEDLT